MTTETKVEAVAWLVTNGGQSCEPWLVYERNEVEALPASCIADPLYPQSALDALRGEVRELTADRDGWMKQAHDRVADWDAQIKLTREQAKRADAAERRVAECLKLADVLDLVSRSPDVTIPQWHRLAGIADEFRDALTKETQ